MKNFFCLVALLFFSYANSQTPPLSWAKRVGGAGYAEVQRMVCDSIGNVYYLGFFSHTVDFDPGPGVTTLSVQSFADIFVSKLDSAGNFVWVKSFNCSGLEWIAGLGYGPAGAIYIGGEFTGGIMDLDPGPGTNTVNSGNNFVGFLVKLDLNGNLIWAKDFDPSNVRFHTIQVDRSDNVYAGGLCWHQADFDPGPGTQTVSASTMGDLFVLKLNSAGQYIWAKNFPYQSGENSVTMNSIDVDKMGNVYSTGAFQSTIDFDPGTPVKIIAPTTSANISSWVTDIFIHKLDAAGNFVWVNTYGNGQRAYGKSIRTNEDNTLSFVGCFSGVIDLDAGAGNHTVSSTPAAGLIVMQLDPSGALKWGRSVGGSVFGMPEGENLEVDADKNLYVTGLYGGNANLDPGYSNFSLNTPTNVMQAFVSKYDSTGQFKWGGAVGGNAFDRGNAVSLGPQGSVYFGGVITSSVADVDPGAGTFTVSADTSTNSLYVIKLQQICSQSIVVNGNSNTYCEQEAINLTATGAGSFNWYSSVSATPTITGLTFTTGPLPAGVHMFTVVANNATCWQDKGVVSVTVDACSNLASRDNRNADVFIYPNPNNGNFILYNNSDNYKGIVEVYGLEGKKLLEFLFDSQFTTVNLDKVDCGVYFLKFRATNGDIKTIKLIKTR